jgi:hypothetical protein
MRINYSSASVCRVASVVLVAVLAAASSAHAQTPEINGCWGRVKDQEAFGYGYTTSIGTDGSFNRHIKSKCAPGELNSFGVINDSQSLNDWTIHMDGEYELTVSPGQITLKQTLTGQAHNVQRTAEPGMRGGVGAKVIWWDTITPHRLDKNGKYKPKPTLQQLINNPNAYVVKLYATLLSDPQVSCTQTGDFQYYYYEEVASLQAYASSNWSAQDGIASVPQSGGVALNKSLLVGDQQPDLMKCTKGPLGGSFAAFDGWPARISVTVLSSINGGSLMSGPGIEGVHLTSGQTEVDIPDFHVCMPDPPGVEITSASGHDYSCGANNAPTAK